MKVKTVTIIMIILSVSILLFGGKIYAKSKNEVIRGNKLIEYSGNKKEYIVPNKVKIIQKDAFAKAKKLKKIVIHKNVKKIHTYFGGGLYSPRLEKIVVEKRNKKYASYKGCMYNKDMTQLMAVPYMAKKLYMSDKCVGVNDETRYLPNLENLRIGKNFIESGYDSLECSPLTAKNTITVAEGNSVFFELNGIIYYKNKDNNIYLYSVPEKLTMPDTFEVPSNVCRIQSLSNNYIRKLIVPESVKFIECGAIQLNNLEELMLANDCSGIFFWSKTLINCPNLCKIIITNDTALMPVYETNLNWNKDVVIYSGINSTAKQYACENNLQWCEYSY